MSETREPCLCCQTSLCCAADNGLEIDFTPSGGFEVSSYYVYNSNPKKCIGEAYVTIDVEKEASPPLSECGTADCYGPGAVCNVVPSEVKNYFFNQVRSLVQAAGDGYELAVYPQIVQVGLAGDCNDGPTEIVDCEKFSLFCYGVSPGTLSCQCNGDTYDPTDKGLFVNYSEATLGYCISHVNTLGYCFSQYYQHTLNFVNSELSGSPLRMAVNIAGSTCEYWCYGVSTTTVPGITACYDRHWAGICWVTDKICYHYMNAIYLCCAVKCLFENNPCPGGGYNWPLTLDCNCSDTYKKMSATGTTDCKLYFIDSGFYHYEQGKCRQTATYGGAIQANEVICSETPNDKDCKCCGY